VAAAIAGGDITIGSATGFAGVLGFAARGTIVTIRR